MGYWLKNARRYFKKGEIGFFNLYAACNKIGGSESFFPLDRQAKLVEYFTYKEKIFRFDILWARNERRRRMTHWRKYRNIPSRAGISKWQWKNIYDIRECGVKLYDGYPINFNCTLWHFHLFLLCFNFTILSQFFAIKYSYIRLVF